MTTEQSARLQEAFDKERGRLLNFIRTRVPKEEDAEDVLQDVFFQLAESYRLTKPVEQVSAWLFTVARNKITDLFRKKKPDPISKHDRYIQQEGDKLSLMDLLPAPDSGPEGEYTRNVVMEELWEALKELPKEQREVFTWHEIEGRSFNEISEETGIGLNTLLSRKRYAVLHLRDRLQQVYTEFLQD